MCFKKIIPLYEMADRYFVPVDDFEESIMAVLRYHSKVYNKLESQTKKAAYLASVFGKRGTMLTEMMERFTD